jgi:hypothetical protein
MRIYSREIQKILGSDRTAPERIFETFSTQEAPRCIGMNATLTTFYFNQTRIFSYAIFPVKKINVGKILKL